MYIHTVRVYACVYIHTLILLLLVHCPSSCLEQFIRSSSVHECTLGCLLGGVCSRKDYTLWWNVGNKLSGRFP